MNKHVILVLSVLCIAVFSSCSSPEADTSIDLSADTPMSVFDLFSEVKVVPLETTPESIMANMGKVIFFESKYYVLDTSSQQIFCFREDGTYVYKIASAGKGPGEYIYVSTINVDPQNKRLLLLDPVGQKVLAYDLQGNFLHSWRVRSQYALGLSGVYQVNDSVLLLTALNDEQVLLYNTRQDSIFAAYYNLGVRHLEGFAPRHHVYQYEGRTYALPPLSRELMDFTTAFPESCFTWDFGSENNSTQQINKLLDQIRSLTPNSYELLYSFQGVGQGKALNHHINGVFETERYRLAFVEFDGKQKHVVIDKKQQTTHVFHQFREGVILPMGNLFEGRVITGYQTPISQQGIDDALKHFPDYPLEFFARKNLPRYHSEILDAQQQQIVANHDPMNQNPFLVVYTFRK